MALLRYSSSLGSLRQRVVSSSQGQVEAEVKSGSRQRRSVKQAKVKVRRQARYRSGTSRVSDQESQETVNAGALVTAIDKTVRLASLQTPM